MSAEGTRTDQANNNSLEMNVISSRRMSPFPSDITTLHTIREYSVDNPPINAIEVRNLNLTYGVGIKTLTVLSSLSLTVPSSIIYALIGPSGCGKTSLLRAIMGFTTPDEGTVKLFGEQFSERPSS